MKKIDLNAEKHPANSPAGYLNNTIIKNPLAFTIPATRFVNKVLRGVDPVRAEINLDKDYCPAVPSDSAAEHNDKVAPDTLTRFINSPCHHPSKELYVIGVTGTNGKTSVSYLIGEVLKAAGINTFVLGTMNSGNKDLSTPEARDISRFMRRHLDQGGTHFIMEVTSEGIDQARILGVEFDLKLLTNITQDHLDYHKTFEIYQNAKMGFMSEGPAHKIYPDYFEHETIDFSTKLLGNFNLLNIKAAASVLRHLDISEQLIQQTLSSCSPPSGRLESIDEGQAFMVLVDYAHTPDGLLNVLNTLKPIATKRNGRLLVLFGCGGDRDRTKRSVMGKIAGDIADLLVITNDNPRQEDSQAIMTEITDGMAPTFKDYVVIGNRKNAIEYIINQAQDNDVVILAGKGHETYQILKSETIHFDDREEASSAILKRLKAKPELRGFN